VKLNGAGGGIFRYYYGALQVDFSSSLGSHLQSTREE
jgi:hypothetical protein